MPSFTYKAVNADGKPMSGVLTAESYQVALRKLDEQALYPIKVEDRVGDGAVPFLGRRRIKARDLTVFYSQLADLLRAGVPMLRSLDVLGGQSAGPIDDSTSDEIGPARRNPGVSDGVCRLHRPPRGGKDHRP